MHPKTSKEIIDATRYLQRNPVVVVDTVVPLCFPSLLLPSFSKSNENQSALSMVQHCYNISLSVQEYKRESSKTELSKAQLQKSYELILKSLFINKASILFNFLLMKI